MARQRAHRGRSGTAGQLGSVLPALESLCLLESQLDPDGVQRLAEGLGAGALPACGGSSCLSTCTWATRAPRRSPPPWAEAPCPAQAPRSDPRRHRRRGAGGPRAGPAAATRAGGAPSHGQPVRRRGPRRPRGTATTGRVCCRRRLAGWRSSRSSTSSTPRSPTPAAPPSPLRSTAARCRRSRRSIWLDIPARAAAVAAVYEARRPPEGPGGVGVGARGVGPRERRTRRARRARRMGRKMSNRTTAYSLSGPPEGGISHAKG